MIDMGVDSVGIGPQFQWTEDYGRYASWVIFLHQVRHSQYS